jgi:hypothetical protein
VKEADGRLWQAYFVREPPGGRSPLNTGLGFGYYRHLRIGATSWFASREADPYRFL